MNHIHTIGMPHASTVYVNAMMTIAVYGCPATAHAKTTLLNAIQAVGNVKLAHKLDESEAPPRWEYERSSFHGLLSKIAESAIWAYAGPA